MSDKLNNGTIDLRKLNRTILRKNEVDFIMTNEGGKEMTKIDKFKASPLFASIAEKILNMKVNKQQLDAITEVYEAPAQLEEGAKQLGNKEPKAVKEPKEKKTKAVKEPKAVKEKATKEPKEKKTKAAKEKATKEPKEKKTKAAKEKATKEPKEKKTKAAKKK